jgi:hypothetical protein
MMHWTWLLGLKVARGQSTPFTAWMLWHYNMLNQQNLA